jgi:hypothetical protein
MRALRGLVLLSVLAALPAGAHAGQSWLGVGTGVVSGDVRYDCPTGRCSESGVFGSLSVNLTALDTTGLRLRGVRAREKTDKRPEELALLVGKQVGVGRGPYLLLGFGRIFNPDNDRPQPANGLAYELLFAGPRPGSNLGFEFSLLGNYAGNVRYFGANFGLRMGNLGGR